MKKNILKENAVPSVFEFVSKKIKRKTKNSQKKEHRYCKEPYDLYEEVIMDTDSIVKSGDLLVLSESKESQNVTVGTQCNIRLSQMTGAAYISLDHIKDDKNAIHYFTGFHDFEHFMMLYRCLGPAVDDLKYKCAILSSEEQLFLTLLKLRQASDNKMIAVLFNISETTVSRVVRTWINFLYFQLKELNTWPSGKVVSEHMPERFKNKFPSTRVILDATEIPIQQPSNVNFQSYSFSSYKNKNTIKTMIGITPNGLVSYVSPSFGGCVSDRQIIEHSEIYLNASDYFNSGDSIMADRGILVQDLYAAYDVFVNTPTMLRGKHQLDSKDAVKDRRIASERIHVERVIGLAKTYKILTHPLPHSLCVLGSKIVFVCFMLVNFRTSIVN